ncbi:unnamed protein product [Adineta steineri]|uniref:NAD(P)(+)--arginine ADP-ribosyltransferase n=1 Tax=Adineta steineri TaxID=433720 RepID=A0A814FE90_9BILA|nr:unnamed protein product [Adineta steineri]
MLKKRNLWSKNQDYDETKNNSELIVRRKNPRLLIKDTENQKVLDPIIGYSQEPLLPLYDACAPLINIIPDVLNYVSIALERTSDEPPDNLTRDESASIRLYTMEWEDSYRSLYSYLNRTLKNEDRKCLSPWFKYLKLFLTAIVKLPCIPPQVVWGGVRKNINIDLFKETQIIWWGFSSTTASLSVLESDIYLGKTGYRTLFSIETFNGTNIRAHSYINEEEEIILLPGTYLEVQSQLNPATDLHIIHLKQVRPNEILLEPPFEKRVTINWNGTNWATSCDFPGNELSNVLIASKFCSAKCIQTQGCTHYVWSTWNNGTCWMKKNNISKTDAILTDHPTMICGIINSNHQQHDQNSIIMWNENN